MVDHKIIALLSSEAGVGRRTLADDLSRFWADAGRQVLVLSEGDSPKAEPPDQWVPRFQGLSPVLLRNYLADSSGQYSSVVLPRLSSEPLLKDLLALAARAYDWVLVMGPRNLSPEEAPLLDAVDLLLWVARPSPQVAEHWMKALEQLASLHLPQQCARVVLSRVPVRDDVREWNALDPLAILPEDTGFGLKRREGVIRLSDVLENETSLYRVRGAAPIARGDEAQVVEQIKSQVQPQLLKALTPDGSPAGGAAAPGHEAEVTQKAIEACLAAETGVGGSRTERSQIVKRVLEDVLGLGPLEPLLKDPEVTEILVNGPGCLYVERRGKLYPADDRFSSEEQLRTIIDRIVAPLGRRVDESSPLCDARLADGSRVNIVLPPLALEGPTVTIRKFSAKKLDLGDLSRLGSLSAEMAEFLRASVVSRKNIIVSGGTGSGKTTLLNALSSAIPDDERIVTIEDAAELKLQKPHVVRLESRPPNAEGQGAIAIRRLVINALRMRPDRIVIGECRGGEALDMLQAMNTGHDGSLTTLHANSPRDALGRLETLVLMAGLELPLKVVREQIRSAVHLVVQQARLPDGSRKVTSITEVTGMEGDLLTTQELYRYACGTFEATGILPVWKGRPGA